jgi:peptidoglycan/LPS O-acetylase OafA/YrhL
MSIGRRSPWIDLIRGVSILLVLLNHFNIAYDLSDTVLAHVAGWNAIRAVARNGNYGVTMFFVISGYLITTNAQRRWPDLGAMEALAFYRLRIARIVPCLLLVVAVVNVLALSGIATFQNHAPEGIRVSLWMVDLAALTFWMNVLIGLFGWVSYPLGVLWSLLVEEVFYLSFPILCLALKSPARLLAFWCAIIVLGPVYRLLHQGDEAYYLYAYLASFDGIAIGCCTGLLARRLAPMIQVPSAVQALVVLAMAILYFCAPIRQTNVLGVTGMAIGTAALLVMEGATAGRRLYSSPVSIVIRWLGKHSYELYLLHLIVLGLLRTMFPRGTVSAGDKLILLVLFLVFAAMVSGAVARFYAEPLNRLLGRYPHRATLPVLDV